MMEEKEGRAIKTDEAAIIFRPIGVSGRCHDEVELELVVPRGTDFGRPHVLAAGAVMMFLNVTTLKEVIDKYAGGN